jgi:anaerobic magnesium-protoporphyrin IX monomethyl ester cyclase
MKIALIWPHGFDPNYILPLSLGYLKSNVNNDDHEIKIIDCALHNLKGNSQTLIKIISNFQPDIVGISCWSTNYNEVCKTLKTIRLFDEKIVRVVGGCHATAYPESLIEHTDFVFRGESEFSFPAFLEEFKKKSPNWKNIKGLCYLDKKGNIVKNDLERETDLDKIKLLDYDAINLNLYLKKNYRLDSGNRRSAPIWGSRGCPYNCQFCSTYLLNGKVIRMHSVDYLIKAVKYLYFKKNIRQVNLIDDNFTFHIDRAKEFCRRIINLNLTDLRLFTPNEIRVQKTDKELLKLMKKAGWESVSIAPESGSLRTLKNMKKGLNPKIIPQKVREIKKAGLKVQGTFIIGYPGETKKDIKETIKLIRKCKFNFFFLNTFQPLPATPIYQKLIDSGKIKSGFLPKNFSSGRATYVTEDLKNLNFSWLRLKEYTYLAITNPLNIPYMFKFAGIKMSLNKIILNLKASFLKN